MSSKKTVLLIDGSSFLYRAYYGMRPMSTSDGVPVHAVYNFCRMVKKLTSDFEPQFCALVWDSKGKTERHEIYPAYKATRQAPPSDLFTQKELICEFADLIGLKQIAQPGVEADDLLYTLAKICARDGYEAIVASSDKDMGQLVETHHIRIYDPFKNIFLDEQAIEEKYGFPHTKLPFYFALVGDTSDNIPGVAGVGEKTAQELVKQFDSLADLYNNLDKVSKERTRKLLEVSRDNAFLSQNLFTLRMCDIAVKPQELVFDEKKWSDARGFFERLEFVSLVRSTTPAQTQTSFLVESAAATKPTKAYTFTPVVVTTTEQLSALCDEIVKTGSFGIDTETDGQPPYQALLVGISIACVEGTSYYIPLQHVDAEGMRCAEQLSIEDVRKKLGPLLSDPKILKYLQNAKFDQLVLARAGMDLVGVIFDTQIAANLVTGDNDRIGLKALSLRYLDQPMLSFNDVVKKRGYKNFTQVPLDVASAYAAADAHQTLALVPVLSQELKKFYQEKLFETIEMPLSYVLYAMEKEGIILDVEILKKIDVHVTHTLTRLYATIVELLGEQFKDINLNSPQQLRVALFEHLKLAPIKKTAQRTAYSTDAETLEKLADAHPVPRLMLKYRELFKLKSTYIDALPGCVNPYTNRIHTTFSQTATATGRLASSDPNLQNIPVEQATEQLNIRAAFLPPEGELFLSVDYSQIELRVLAYLSQDAALLGAFARGEDIHARTASGLFDVALESVTHDQRQLAKRINFSILYGLTPYGLSQDLHIPLKDARLYIEKYFAQYPGVVVWMESVLVETKKHGYVTTLFGRRRPVPGIYEKNKNLYDAACRIAINTRAQGTAAELMKIGMIKLFDIFSQKKLGAKMVLQIHDELLITVPEQDIKIVEKLVIDVLQSSVDWSVPLVVTTRVGKNWAQVTK